MQFPDLIAVPPKPYAIALVATFAAVIDAAAAIALWYSFSSGRFLPPPCQSDIWVPGCGRSQVLVAALTLLGALLTAVVCIRVAARIWARTTGSV